MKLVQGCFFGVLLFSVAFFNANAKNVIKIVATGETHAMTHACDCPEEPGGGLAKRSYVLKTLGNRSNVLLLDAGGFSGGGIYDMYTEGRENDSVRTLVTIDAMGNMAYDAVAIGDDDLQYGAQWLVKQAKAKKVPLVSANCYFNGNLLVDPYIVVEKGKRKIGITALTSTESLFKKDKKIVIKDPVESLKKVWEKLSKESDCQIIISHLGQEASEELVKSFPQCDLIVNGHRKMGSDVIVSGEVPILQFNFQGKALAVAEAEINKKKTDIVNSFWLPIDNNVPDDTTLTLKFQGNQAQVKPVYDLYIMSMCPYGLEALAGFMEFVEAFKNVEWNLWFIGDVDKDTTFSSLHGASEVNEEMVWCAVKNLYPNIWNDFLKARSTSQGSLELVLKGLNADLGKIESWIKANGKKNLHAHYLRSMRQKIEASPTLLVNNYPFQEKISKSRLGKIHCNMSSDQFGYCDSVPECFSNSDCKKSGKIGQCLGNGNCEYRDALPFEFIVVVADSATQKLHNEVVKTTQDLFPGAKVEIVSYGSPRGMELVKKYNPSGLPLYLFGKDVQHAHNFMSIESGLIQQDDYFTFKRGILPQNYYHKREFVKDELVLFVDPFFAKIDEILGQIVNDSLVSSKIKIYPVFDSEGEDTYWGTLEMFRCVEAQRWLLLAKEHNTFIKYLREYIKLKSDFSWFTNIKGSGIDVDSFVNVMKADTTTLKNHRAFLDKLDVSGPVTVLIDNRELVVIRNSFELKKILGKILK